MAFDKCEAINLLAKWWFDPKEKGYYKKLKKYHHIKNAEINYNIWWYWSWKRKFHQQRSPITIYVNIGRIVLSNKISFGKKGFKNKNDYEKVVLLCTMLPKMSTYRREFDEK